MLFAKCPLLIHADAIELVHMNGATLCLHSLYAHQAPAQHTPLRPVVCAPQRTRRAALHNLPADRAYAALTRYNKCLFLNLPSSVQL